MNLLVHFVYIKNKGKVLVMNTIWYNYKYAVKYIFKLNF